MVKQIIESIVCALKPAKNDTITHDNDMIHGMCLFMSKDTYEKVQYVEAMGLFL